MNTPTAAHLCIYGIVFAVMAVSASLAAAKVQILDESDEPTVLQRDMPTAYRDPVRNEPKSPEGGSDTYATQFSETPLVVDLKASSDSGSSNTDDITKNTTLTFTVTGSRPYGGDSVIDNEDNLLIIYKNNPCDIGGAIPTDGIGWGNSSEEDGWATELHADWRNSHGFKSIISTQRTSHEISINMLLNDNNGTPVGNRYSTPLSIPLTPADGVKCFVATHSLNSLADGTGSNTTSTGFELVLDRTAPTVSIVETTTGTVYAYANEMTPTVKTKNNVATGSCTDSTSTATGWSDYTPNGTTVTFSGSGRCFIFTDIAGNTKAAHTSAKSAGTLPTDYDSDNDNLIDITTPAQLDAVRHDSDGNGIPDYSRNVAAVRNAFTGTLLNGYISGCQSTCTGYELMNDLDIDTDGDGTADSGDAYWNGGAGWSPIDGFARDIQR